MDLVETHFEEAGDFLEFLRLSSDHWGTEWDSNWVFRGQGSHEWNLIPRAWRKETEEELGALSVKLQPAARQGCRKECGFRGMAYNSADPLQFLLSEVTSESGEAVAEDRLYRLLLQLAVEEEVVRQFVGLGEELGYQIGGSEKFIEGSHFAQYPQSRRIFRNTVREEAGLAQHHGIPTRLLDWTRRPEVAAFFAALSASGERLAVWALDLAACRKPNEKFIPTIMVLTCRRYRNSFLHAQDGVFTWITWAEAFFLRNDKWPTSEEVLSSDPLKDSQSEFAVRKLTLARRQRSELIRLLWREKVSQAHLMPTYDYISKSLKLRWGQEELA